MRQNTIVLAVLDDRANELRDERDELEGMPLRMWEAEYGEELEELESVISECSGSGDGLDTLLINEDYFVKYAQELCEDLGEVPLNFPHYIVIDWEATADNIKMDYSTVILNGATYYYRYY